MKLWDKNQSVNELVERFTIGRDPEFDLHLARYDIEGSAAHVKMLASIGLIDGDELPLLVAGLEKLAGKVAAGEFAIEPGVEDVHSQVELELTRMLGDIGKKIHSGRSRNDQVLVDLRLFFRAEIREIADLIRQLFDILTDRSEASKDILMPGYTHTQVAMVSSFGLWFGAYAETLVDDLRLLNSVYDIINQNPLGSAAGYGNSLPLNRKMTTELLGFRDLNYNVIHAQMGRGKTEQFLAFAMAALGGTLGKLAADICLFSSQNFGFLKLPDAYTTGSSIMPHKKNPDVFELIRAKCNLLQTIPQRVFAVTANLISGYHRDFQLLKEQIFPAITDLKDCLLLTIHCLPEIRLRENILDDDNYQLLYTVEAVNEEVLKGTPFREAYKKIGLQVENGAFAYHGKLHHTHEGSLGNLCTEEIRRKFLEVWRGF